MVARAGFPALSLTVLLMVVGVTTPAQGVLNENMGTQNPAEKQIAENSERIHKNEVDQNVTEQIIIYQQNLADSLMRADTTRN